MKYYKECFCAFTAAICFACGTVNAVADSANVPVLAVKTSSSEIDENDRFIIVFEEAEVALSDFAQDNYLAGVPVKCSEGELTRIPENAAVFRWKRTMTEQ